MQAGPDGRTVATRTVSIATRMPNRRTSILPVSTSARTAKPRLIRQLAYFPLVLLPADRQPLGGG
jgi:hypothetical protein